MTTWTCPATEAPCKDDKKPPTYTDDQKKKWAGRCPNCKSKLVELKGKAEDKKAESHDETLVRTVTEAHEGAKKVVGTQYSDYVRFVLDSLIGLPKVFQDDFLREWKTGEVQLKLYDGSQRLSGKSLDCVQQAVAAAGLAWPKKIPTGEKFQFELPYIIGTGLAWTVVGDIGSAYKQLLKTMKPEPNRLYLVSAQSAPSGSVEGHMILIVTDGKANAWLADFQNQKSAARALGCLDHYYCAWSYPRPASFQLPKGSMEIEFG